MKSFIVGILAVITCLISPSWLLANTVVYRYDIQSQSLWVNDVQVQNVVFITTPLDGGDGRKLFHAVYIDNGELMDVSTREGNPCTCEPGWLLHVYIGDDAAPRSQALGLDATSSSVVHIGNEVTITDSMALRSFQADWNASGNITVEDLFWFLRDHIAGTTGVSLATFLIWFFSGL